MRNCLLAEQAQSGWVCDESRSFKVHLQMNLLNIRFCGCERCRTRQCCVSTHPHTRRQTAGHSVDLATKHQSHTRATAEWRLISCML